MPRNRGMAISGRFLAERLADQLDWAEKKAAERAEMYPEKPPEPIIVYISTKGDAQSLKEIADKYFSGKQPMEFKAVKDPARAALRKPGTRFVSGEKPTLYVSKNGFTRHRAEKRGEQKYGAGRFQVVVDGKNANELAMRDLNGIHFS